MMSTSKPEPDGRCARCPDIILPRKGRMTKKTVLAIGIEPSFAHHYSRNVIREGKKSKEKVEVFSYELLAFRTLVNPEAMPYATEATRR